MLEKLKAKFGTSFDDVEEERLKKRFSDFELADLGSVPVRKKVIVAGEVQGSQVVPRAGSPSLEITIEDGTGRATAVFTGRRRMGGLCVGRRIILEGVGRSEGARVIFLNPAYTIIE